MLLGNDLVGHLKQTYPNCEIYTEKIVQGLQPPCFLVQEQETEFRRCARNRFRCSVPVQITYFPENQVQSYGENLQMGISLCETLQSLEDGKLRGKEMRFSQKEDRLIFFVRFEADYYLSEQSSVLMRTMTKEVIKDESV